MNAPLSLVLIAANEERAIGGCLASAAALADLIGDIVLVDDSRDEATVTAARAALAGWRRAPELCVFRRPYDGQARQSNFAMAQARGAWLLLLDCDERLSAAMRIAVRRQVSEGSHPQVAVFFPRRNLVFGRWLRHGGNYPDFNHARLVRRGQVRFADRSVHAHLLVEGPVAYSHAPLLHQSYPDLRTYFNKFNAYTTREAVEMAAAGRRFSATRMWIESLGHLAQRGVRHAAFLDGVPGMVYLSLGFAYDLVRHWKLRELQHGGAL